MAEETNKKDDGWSMPDPVYRSTEGRDVKAEAEPEPNFETTQSDIPTEPANRDLPTEASINIGSQGIRPKANRHIRHKNKRKKGFLDRNAAGLIVLGVLLIGALIYLAWLYRGKIL